MSKVYTSWTEATNNTSKAMISLISCLNRKNCSIYVGVRK